MISAHHHAASACARTHICTHTYAQTHAHACACAHAHRHMHTHARAHTRTQTHVRTQTRTRMHTHTCTHAHTHTCSSVCWGFVTSRGCANITISITACQKELLVLRKEDTRLGGLTKPTWGRPKAASVREAGGPGPGHAWAWAQLLPGLCWLLGAGAPTPHWEDVTVPLSVSGLHRGEMTGHRQLQQARRTARAHSEHQGCQPAPSRPRLSTAPSTPSALQRRCGDTQRC